MTGKRARPATAGSATVHVAADAPRVHDDLTDLERGCGITSDNLRPVLEH